MIGTLQEWRPQAEVTDHEGNRLQENRHFFVTPPLEIGQIVSAETSIEFGKDPNPTEKRLVIAAVFAAIGGAFAWIAIANADLSSLEKIGALILGCGVGGCLGFFVGDKNNSCSYVGAKGIARFKLKKDSEQTRQGEVFLFENAAELRTTQTRHYTNGIYTGTAYSFSWSDANRKRLFRLAGQYRSQKGTPKTGDPFYYARAAEAAWSAFAFERAKADLARNGVVRFNITGANHILVGSGFIEIHTNGQTARCNQNEIARITIKQGIVTLRRVDAKSGFFGIGSSGIFTFKYADIGNARLFLVLLDHLVGVDFS
jgi:hypothetical protein